MHYPTISFHVLCLKIIEYFFFEILHYISVIINEMYFKFYKKAPYLVMIKDKNEDQRVWFPMKKHVKSWHTITKR